VATPAELTVRNLFGKQAPKPKPATGKTYRGKAGDNFDEFNRQSGAAMGKVRVPPSDAEIETFFTSWQHSIPQARKYLPAAGLLRCLAVASIGVEDQRDGDAGHP
jgi:hypothetical protein